MTPIYVLGEALMDCVATADGLLHPHVGGSPFNLARAAALRGGQVSFLNRFSQDQFGDQMQSQLARDGVQTVLDRSRLPTALAVVQVKDGQPSYGFYREGIADRDYRVAEVLQALSAVAPGVLHTGSLMLVPPEHEKVLAVLQGAKKQGWTISVDVNLRPKLVADLDAYVAAVKAVTALADWLKASDEDLQLLGFAKVSKSTAPDIARSFATQGASRIALTFGAEGAWLRVDGQAAEASAPQVRVVDTVGAGDTFWGNCLADWTQEPPAAAQRVQATLENAMRAAAINCTRAGCQPPTRAELFNWQEKSFAA
ncbi:MAG: PfkB family carbohydrate kinase [Rhodoferax sp.]|nr:PfkB family carbohydrate kinase [Rhodoferax sp.]